MSRRGVVVCGYYGFGNIGDEAVLAGLVHGVQQVGCSEPFIVLSAHPSHTSREYGVEAVSRTDMKAVWRALRRSRAFVLGGGSLLQDVTSARSIVYYLGMHALARRAGCQIAWIGQGIGPLRWSWARRWTAIAARQAQVVVTRDPDSAAILRAMGVAQIEEGGDLSFLLPPADEERGWNLLQKMGIKKGAPVIVLAPRRWRAGRHDAVAVFRSIASTVRQEIGANVLIIPMHTARDKELAEAIAADVPGAFVCRDQLPVQDVRSLFTCCEAVVGVRLHALMFAASSGVPALALSYDPKVRAFWQQVAPEHMLDVTEVDEPRLTSVLAELWARRHELRERVQKFAMRQRELAQRNIDALLRVVS